VNGWEKNVDEIEKIIGYSFKNKELLCRAFTHNSFAKLQKTKSYQALEFLGDSILDFLVAERLMELIPSAEEGLLTKLRSTVVSARPLAQIVGAKGLNRYLLMGAGEAKQHIDDNDKVRSDIFEAMIAAVYLDGGMKAAKTVALGLLADKLNAAASSKFEGDHKSDLNEFAAKNEIELQYVLSSSAGEAHSPEFCFDVMFEGVKIGSGAGKSKKDAQQAAAKAALEYFKLRGRSLK
jgi:ribonuclease-3